tara:strand:+ start:201 stop:368 length:168 start_codon:yes stop_codon:yes gene_type:complete
MITARGRKASNDKKIDREKLTLIIYNKIKNYPKYAEGEKHLASYTLLEAKFWAQI